LYLLATFGSVLVAPHAAASPTWQRMLIALLPLPAIVYGLVKCVTWARYG
jgi:hypothetical protein